MTDFATDLAASAAAAGGGGPAGWFPTEAEVLVHAALLCYYDMEHVATAATAITQYLDRGPLGNHSAVQGTAGKRPTLTPSIVNGLAIARYAGAQCIQTPSLTVTSFTAIGLLVNSTDAAGNIIHEQSADSNTIDGFILATSNAETIRVRNGGVKTERKIGVEASATWLRNRRNLPTLFTHQYLGFNYTHALHLDGNTMTPTAAGASSSDPGIAAITGIVNLGARNNAASAGMSADLATWMCFSPALTGYERQAVARMLAVKYALGAG